jgi:hypothetical protein
MWNLNGNDIQRAKEELKGRRAAIQARFDNEMKQLQVDIADIETFERFAVKFVSDFKGEKQTAAPPVADSTPAAENAAAEVAAEQSGPANPEFAVAPGTEAEPAPAPDSAAGPKSSSRWRMRLNTGEVSP